MLRPDLAPLDVYLADAMLLETDEFLARHSWPVLVIAQPDWDKIARLSRPETLIPGQPTPALYEMIDPTSAASSGASLDVLCLPLRPKDEGREVILIGRAPETDVVLLDETVSKLHAEAIWNAERELCVITDHDSKNGTFLDDTRLPPKTPFELTPGAVLVFGSLMTKYYSPRAFLAWLATGAARAGAPGRKY